MANIFEIQSELKAIFAEIEDNEGDVTPELEERLTISEQNFTEKVKSYANAIKELEVDLTAIKDEKNRLSDLQKSKEKTIDRLKNVIATAINTYGAINKSGNHFVDYGTGKISVRTSESVEVEEDVINRFTNRFMSCLEWYKMQNQLSQSIIDYKDMLNYINSKTPEEEDTDVDVVSINIDECDNINFDFDTKLSFRELLQSEKGFNLAKAIIEYGDYKVNAKVDKKAVKDSIKETKSLPSYAYLKAKDIVTIK